MTYSEHRSHGFGGNCLKLVLGVFYDCGYDIR